MNIKAYPPAWAQGEALRAAARRWQQRGLLTPAQQAAIEVAHPAAYYRPNNWIRVLLAGVTLLAAASALGFSVLMTNDKLSPVAYGVLVLLAAGAALELVIKNSSHYRSGADNALLYVALLAWGFLVYYPHENTMASGSLTSPTLWYWLLPILLALLAALVRYADPLVATGCFIVALGLLTNGLLQSTIGQIMLPFGVMAAVGALLLALRRLPARADFFYYRSAGLVLRVLGLAVLYLAGNYLVVREGNAELLGGGSPSAQIPFAPLFYLFTAGIPLVYLVLGLRRHDRLLLTLGLLTLAFSIYTLRYYRTLLPPEVAATIGGLLLLAGALAALRYLRTPHYGLTAAADEAATPQFNLESLVVAQTAHAPAAPEAGFQFGGGQSGGGGAEGSF